MPSAQDYCYYYGHRNNMDGIKSVYIMPIYARFEDISEINRDNNKA